MDNTAKNSETVVSKLTMSKAHKVRFSISFFIFALLWMGGLGIVSAVLLPQHLKDLVGPTASTAIFGVLNAATAIASLLANLIFGNLSESYTVAIRSADALGDWWRPRWRNFLICNWHFE